MIYYIKDKGQKKKKNKKIEERKTNKSVTYETTCILLILLDPNRIIMSNKTLSLRICNASAYLGFNSRLIIKLEFIVYITPI